jgi:hypothetical protein
MFSEERCLRIAEEYLGFLVTGFAAAPCAIVRMFVGHAAETRKSRAVQGWLSTATPGDLGLVRA